jgi:hypothetical protein
MSITEMCGLAQHYRFLTTSAPGTRTSTYAMPTRASQWSRPTTAGHASLPRLAGGSEPGVPHYEGRQPVMPEAGAFVVTTNSNEVPPQTDEVYFRGV